MNWEYIYKIRKITPNRIRKITPKKIKRFISSKIREFIAIHFTKKTWPRYFINPPKSKLDFIRLKIDFIRTKKWVTRILGPKHKPDHNRIEIAITYDCNVKCFNCVQSCRQAPTKECMTVQQIKKFIKESIEQNRKWEHIRVLGGEPTLYPKIFEILNLLLNYKKNFSPNTKVVLVTNGFGPKVNNILSKIPDKISIENSRKSSSIQPNFVSINIAPTDLKEYKDIDYSNGCWVTNVCGIGLSPYGYYPCLTAASIDRVFGFDTGRKRLPSSDDSMRDQLRLLCKYCGFFKHFNKVIGAKEEMSQSWKRAYKKYKRKKPVLSLY